MPLIAYKTMSFRPATERVIAQAIQILREYARQGFDLTLRQLYYQFVARTLIANTDRDYKRLGSIVNDARLAGLIDWDFIIDRTRFLRSLSSWDDPQEIIGSAAGSYREDLWARQQNHVEVWIEKDALVGVIEGICNELRVPFLSCRGYVSQSEMWQAAQRFGSHLAEERNVVLLHLGDHDPSGVDMSRDIEERIRDFLWGDGWDHYDTFTVERIALTWEQVEQYGPPPNPTKITDSRARGYISEYGRDSWELDALEPKVIADLIEERVLRYRNDVLWEETLAEEQENRKSLEAAAQRWPDVAAFLNGGHRA